MAHAALNMPGTQITIHSEWALRLAQRAFSALLEAVATLDNIGIARARPQARRTLRELSADDRKPFDRWLTLQLATVDGPTIHQQMLILNVVDAFLAASVRVRLPSTVAELGQLNRAGEVA